MSARDTIIYIPYSLKGGKVNDYSVNMVKILERKYTVVGELAEPTDIFNLMKTKAVILNWVEEGLDVRMKMQLCLHKLFGAKIIWVYHNKFPHEATRGDRHVIGNMKWLADHANHIMLHSKSSEKYIPNYHINKGKKAYIPHILYEKRLPQVQMAAIRKEFGINENDFVFSMFGFLRPYKHYEEGIKAFKQLKMENAKLILAGSSSSVEYARYLKSLCEDNRNIILDIRYIPDLTLDAIIGVSDVIVLPYVNESSMNSGVMIQAFSNEKTVITPNICMARDYAPHGFIYRYKHSLCKAMRKAYKNGKEVNAQMGRKAYEYVRMYNNEDAVARKLYYILEHGLVKGN